MGTDGRTEITLRVNGQERSMEVRNDETLLKTLRRELGLTSVRSTCGIGICGTCTVLIDGRAVSSCLMLSVMADGRTITTSEGLLTDDGELDPVQSAFVRHGAYQCSFCIPAMTLTVRAYLDEAPTPTAADLREYLAGNLCRCGSYPQILEAAMEVAGIESDRDERETSHSRSAATT
jgi:aerobic-type carbon monoxide dehydrogenase small subunit (CoxS/CutS family)